MPARSRPLTVVMWHCWVTGSAIQDNWSQTKAVWFWAGSSMSLRLTGSRLLSIQINQHQLEALASNGGLLQADGGQVLLTAGARDSVLASAVNNTGVVQARTVQQVQGKIVLQAGGSAGKLQVGGKLDASAVQPGNAGSIDTSAAAVQLDSGVQISTQSTSGSTGERKIAASDVAITRDGPSSHGSGLNGTVIANALANSNVTIETLAPSGSGAADMWVNASIAWSSPNQLSLKASRDIYINDVIAATHSKGQLQLAVGQASADGYINAQQARYWVNAPVTLKSGWNFSTQTGSAGGLKSYYVITDLGAASSKTGTDLQGIDEGVNPQASAAVQSRNYVLGADIDASATKSWNGGKGFRSLFQTNLTTDEISYQGTFDGLGHVISGLTINRPDTGVLSFMSVLGRHGVIQNLGMNNVNYTTNNTGGLVFRNFGLIRNTFVDQGTITAGDSFKNKSNFIGGLVGHNQGQIVDSYANVTVAMPDNSGTYTKAAGYSYKVGGLVGVNSGTVSDSYATGKVYVSSRTASNPDGSEVAMFYAGGLIGHNTTDSLTGTTGSVKNSFWYAQAFEKNASPPKGMKAAVDGVGLVGAGAIDHLQINPLTDVQFKNADSFKAWDMQQVWWIYEGYTRPLLRAFMTPLYLKASASGYKTYDGSVNFNTWSVDVPTKPQRLVAGQTTMVLNNADAGERQAIASGQYSDQYGFQILYDFSVNSVLVNKATLTLTAQAGTFYIGQSITDLKGSITGFVANESMQTAVHGELQWTTQANHALLPGQYAIEGVGVTAKNYTLTQALGNATALNLRALAPSPVLAKTMALSLQPQATPSGPRTLANPTTATPISNDAEPVASSSTDNLNSRKGASIFEFCLPKPPSMVSVMNVVCIRSKQR